MDSFFFLFIGETSNMKEMTFSINNKLVLAWVCDLKYLNYRASIICSDIYKENIRLGSQSWKGFGNVVISGLTSCFPLHSHPSPCKKHSSCQTSTLNYMRWKILSPEELKTSMPRLSWSPLSLPKFHNFLIVWLDF